MATDCRCRWGGARRRPGEPSSSGARLSAVSRTAAHENTHVIPGEARTSKHNRGTLRLAHTSKPPQQYTLWTHKRNIPQKKKPFQTLSQLKNPAENAGFLVRWDACSVIAAPHLIMVGCSSGRGGRWAGGDTHTRHSGHCLAWNSCPQPGML